MDACSIGNLGDKAQNNRLRMGLLGLGGALLLAVVLISSGASPLVRAALFVPFFFGSFGALQGLFRTCTFAAKQGLQVSDDGVSKLFDEKARERMRREGAKVMLGSVLSASMATVLCVAV